MKWILWGGGGWHAGSGLSGVHQSGGGGGGGANPPADQPIRIGAMATLADASAEVLKPARVAASTMTATFMWGL